MTYLKNKMRTKKILNTFEELEKIFTMECIYEKK